MNVKTILGSLVTGLVLFVFGFLYWAINPLPYNTWNEVEDPAAAQKQAQALFPEDGLYFLPGPGNDPTALELLETGPAVFLVIDHSPAAGADPSSLAMGFVHNVLTALLLVLVLQNVAGFGRRISAALLLGVIGVVVINGSEIIWWMQPPSWILHQAIYYLAYFAIAAAVLHPFLGDPAAE